MQARDFCYWLQGFFEITEADGHKTNLRDTQVDIIKRHLTMVFAHDIDPKMGDPEHQKKLNNIHNWDGKGLRPRC
jgi:hypothetical protein